jgi:lipoprotein-releasing system permease protein
MKIFAQISTRYIFSKKYKYLPSFSAILAFLGVFLSVATLILVLSVMNGFKEDFEKLVIGTRPHITVYPDKSTFENADTITEIIRQSKDTASVNKVINGEGVISVDGKTSGVMIKGVNNGYFSSSPLLSKSIIEGKMEENGVVLGIELAHKLRVNIGDKLLLA